MANLKITYLGAGRTPLFLSDIELTPGAPRTLKLPPQSYMILSYTGDVVSSYTTGVISQYVGRGRMFAEMTDDPVQAAKKYVLPTGPAGGGLGGTYPNPTSGLSIPGQVQGSVLYFNGTSWAHLPPGPAGRVFTTNGANANPTWTAPTIATPLFKEERFLANSFAFDGGVSAHVLQAAAGVSAGAVAYARLFVNGIRDVSYTKVTQAPSSLKEWRLSGSSLVIFGDVTATGNTYDIEYL